MTGKVLLSFAVSVFSLISADILDLSHSLHFVFIEGCCDISEAHVLSHGDKDWWGISSSLLTAYSGKLVAGFVTVHNSAYLPSRICGPTVQNDLLCLWGPQARLISFCSVYSVGSSTLGLPQEVFTTFLLPALSIPTWNLASRPYVICHLYISNPAELMLLQAWLQCW